MTMVDWVIFVVLFLPLCANAVEYWSEAFEALGDGVRCLLAYVREPRNGGEG